ncbi:hypothetical protein C4E24_01975 [ANME-1 cluster archaeon AG-394-G21]|nr:hypothetical protein [ANME-1 cluster archaeon AG-394-G21]
MNRKAIGVGMVVAILIVIAFVSLVSADHYAVNVTTGNTTWGIDRTTLPISFDMSGTVSGYGTMILDHNIDLAGVGKNGMIHTHPGEVTISEILDLKSTTDRVNITATVQGDNVTMTVIEAWPTSLIDEIELSYNGKGMSSWETYSNNNDVICSRFRAMKLEKESRCNTTLIKTVVRAVITPENVTESKGFVTGTDYKLKSTSDKFSHLGYKHVENDKIVIMGSESYFGNFSIETAIKMAAFVAEPKDEEPEEWLPCPWGEP